MEAWRVHFDRASDGRLLYSCSDDASIARHDIRQSSHAFKRVAHHSAGVTSLHTDANYPHLLVSGSYDDSIRVWDKRKMKASLARLPLGGGVWRIEAHPNQRNLLLTACMYEGVKIVDLSAGKGSYINYGHADIGKGDVDFLIFGEEGGGGL